MKAFQLLGPEDAVLRDVDPPRPGPANVILRVDAAGLCHSDLHLLADPSRLRHPLPLTLGHEIAGTVVEVGARVETFTGGETVLVYGVVGCGHCPACLAGEDNRCETDRLGGPGISSPGGLAEFVEVPARQLVGYEDLAPAEAAPLTDAALTAFHAVQCARETLTPGRTAIVIGVGGLGQMAVQVLRATTAVRVVAVDPSRAALATAVAHGAHHALTVEEVEAGALDLLLPLRPGGAAAVLDFVGSDASLSIAATHVSTHGWLVAVGHAGGQVGYGPGGSVPFGTRVAMPYWGTRADLSQVIALARDGAITPVTRTYDLGDIAQAVDDLRHGRLGGARAVLLPGGPR